MLDEMYKHNNDIVDAIYVINLGGYIGESTRSKIECAKSVGNMVITLEKAND